MEKRAFVLFLARVLAVVGPIACQREEETGVEAAGEEGTGAGAGTDQQAQMLSTQERDFIQKAIEGHRQEIQKAQMAQQKSMNNNVRDYASTLVDDHRNAIDELNMIMSEYGQGANGGQTTPQQSTPQGSQQQGSQQQGSQQLSPDMEKLNRLSGAQFDREFLTMVTQQHQQSLSMYQSAASMVRNEDLGTYIDDFTQTIQDHIQQAQDLQKELTGSGTQTN